MLRKSPAELRARGEATVRLQEKQRSPRNNKSSSRQRERFGRTRANLSKTTTRQMHLDRWRWRRPNENERALPGRSADVLQACKGWHFPHYHGQPDSSTPSRRPTQGVQGVRLPWNSVSGEGPIDNIWEGQSPKTIQTDGRGSLVDSQRAKVRDFTSGQHDAGQQVFGRTVGKFSVTEFGHMMSNCSVNEDIAEYLWHTKLADGDHAAMNYTIFMTWRKYRHEPRLPA